jgi:hypothetical protein
MGLILIFSVPTTTSTITILPILGIDWKHYKHLLPEHVYDVYMLLGGYYAIYFKESGLRDKPCFLLITLIS